LIRLILNNNLIVADDPPGMLLLDLVRYREHLMGTKIGCREGDCGACTVLIGELKEGRMSYRSATSCLTALGNVHQRHVVTVEGVNLEGLSPLQQAICEEGGTQCGFCTPGFIVSMAGFCLSDKAPTQAAARAAVDGNICRCTGYKSIERALERMRALLALANRTSENEGATTRERVKFLVDKGILPAYFLEIPQRLAALALEPNGVLRRKDAGGETRGASGEQRGVGQAEGGGQRYSGGGTDLYVQRPEKMVGADVEFLSIRKEMQGVVREGNRCVIGGGATVTDLMESAVMRGAFPHFDRIAHLISSTPIRNIATVAGNFVNASPIGDLTIFFLALDAQLLLSDGTLRRELPLRKFFLGYKQLDKKPEEFIEKIFFHLPDADELFHFEKVSKRTCLDIASVNTAMWIRMKGEVIAAGRISAGGVGPVPAILEGASSLMTGRNVNEALVQEVVEKAFQEISPISDARGAAAYKRLLLGQLIKAHFLTLFPTLEVENVI
jgi:xanthine dehydrogenase small subunit